MKQITTLIRPRILSFRHNGNDKNRIIRLTAVSGVGLALWAGIFAISFRVLVYFRSIEDFGDILAGKLLSMVLLTFFSLLLFSSILTSLSKLYLSKDLLLVHSMPVTPEKIFLSRWIESTVDSSWMVVAYTIPVLLSYGLIYKPGFFFYFNIVLTLLPLCVISSALSALMVMFAVTVLPANRIRSIFIFLGIAAVIIVYITFRLMKPERLVDPDSMQSLLVYLQNLQSPASPLIPSTWAYDSLMSALRGNVGGALFHVSISWTFGIFLLFFNVLVSRFQYFNGYSKTQEAMIRLFQTKKSLFSNLLTFLPGPIRAFISKETKSFWRDQTQWSQLFLLGALVAIYLYNFSVLPLEKSPVKTIYLQNLFSFLNMGLAAFVLTAVAGRFAYPSVSMEGSSFWIVKSGPISIKAFLWIKFLIYFIPLLVLTLVLIIATNRLLHVTPFMMQLSVITILFMTPGIVSLGVGLGAVYPDFTSENPVQSVTSFGGLIFMLISAAFIGTIIILEAGPVYSIFIADIRGHSLSTLQKIWTGVSFFIAFVISILVIILPMRFGEKKLRVYK